MIRLLRPTGSTPQLSAPISPKAPAPEHSAPAACGRPIVQEATRTVLVAEDDQAMQRILERGLRGLNGFKVVIVPNGQEALTYLQSHKVDALVTDLQMPVMDGYHLIGQVASRYPHIPIFVVTATSPEEHGYRPVHQGALLVFPKPPKLAILLEEIQAAVERPLDGEVRGLSLQSLLQVLEWERKDCTLIVRSGQRTGLLYVREGQLIHGALRDLEGLHCVHEILSWDQIEVELVNVCKVEATLHQSLPALLMDAAIARDHRQVGPCAARAV